MHANLIISKEGGVDEIIKSLANKLNAKILEFPIQKIEDTRNLNSLIRLSFSAKTLIVCKNIQNATVEALNAFLKNLEEPSENIFYALTSDSLKKVLPTITSRCQIIRHNKFEEYKENKKVVNFVNKNLGGKFLEIEKIKERQDAIAFVENLISYLHNQINNVDGGSKEYKRLANIAEASIKTLTNIKGGGNINLQLISLAISFG